MDDLNQKILKAMQESNAEQDDFSEQKANALQLIIHSFNGTFRLTLLVVLLIQLCSFGFAIFCGIGMFNEADAGPKIHWLAGGLLAVITFAIARLYLFMELNRLSVLRALKRVELQLSVVAKNIN